MSTAAIEGSHQVCQISPTKVAILGLELFTGFSKEYDQKGSRFEKYDKEKVEAIIRQTKSLMACGQNPKLILRHNDGESDRPVVGDVVRIDYAEIAGAPGIVGDIVMSKVDFDSLVASNRYPRRSAEITKNNRLVAVALLGSEAPARPLPDTRFSEDESETMEVRGVACFELGGWSQPSSTNVSIGTKVEKVNPMEERIKKIEEFMDKVAKFMSSKSEKPAEAPANEKCQDDSFDEKFAAKIADYEQKIASLQCSLNNEMCGRAVDQMIAEGYKVKDRDELVARFSAAKDLKAEVEFFKSIIQRGPVGVVIDQSHAVTGNKSDDKLVEAAERARDRCIAEGKPEKFSYYYKEEMAK